MRFPAYILAATLVSCTPAAMAQDATGADNLVLAFLKAADVNADGLVTKDEATAFVERTRQGKREEAAKAWSDLVSFVGVPAGTGEIDGKDYADALRRTTEAADADRDGSVSAKERSEYIAGLPNGPRKVIVTDVLASLDTDKDGVIAAGEIAAAMEAVKAGGTMSLKVIADAAARQADTEGLLFRMMAESNGDAEGRIRVADFDKGPVEPAPRKD